MALIDFINTFNNSRKNVYTIDPLNTFSISMDLYPTSSKLAERITKCGFKDHEEFSNNLDKFVQRITLPNFIIAPDSQVDTIAHTAVSHKMFLNPDQQTFTMDIINTKVPLIEEIFYPWMREVQFPAWGYSEQPYTTATFNINLLSHTDISYVLLKCRPTAMDTYNPAQDLGALTRTVTFTFDLMYVKYHGNYDQKSLSNFAGKLVNKALKTIGL